MSALYLILNIVFKSLQFSDCPTRPRGNSHIDIPVGSVTLTGFSWATMIEDGSTLVSVRSSSIETSGVGVISGI